MKIYEGSIVTCDTKGSVARYLVEDEGRIVHVGDQLPSAYGAPGLERVALGEKALLPAFADTHIHFMSHALFSGGLDVRNASSIAEVEDLVASFAAKRKDKVLIGFGASAHSVTDGRLVSRADLDRAAPGRRIFLVKYDGHAAIASGALLAALPEVVASSRGYDAEGGLLTQEAFFRATDYVTGTVSLPATLGNMIRTVDAMAANGIGMIHSVSGVGFPGDLDVTMETIFGKGLRNEIAYRLFFQTMDVDKALKRKLPRIGGCFATALDGCYGSEDAALLEPYSNDSGNRGVLYYDDEVVKAFAIAANRAGLQIEVHAIGDRAFVQAVAAIEAALLDTPRSDHRHTIIHACLPTEEGLETCARLGIAIAIQSSFLHWDQEPLDYLERIMGDRVYRISPLASMRRMGIVMAGGSDAPCTLPDPIHGIWAACNHYVAGESLSIQDALNLYTRNAAYIGFDEAERGSLEMGKRADFALLSGNPLATAPSELRSLKVESLTLGGKPYRTGQRSTELIARGLLSGRKI